MFPLGSVRNRCLHALSRPTRFALGSRFIHCGILLIRPPVLNKTPSPLEEAIYAYNRELQLQMSQDFAHEFFLKKGSLAEKTWLETKKKLQHAENASQLLHQETSGNSGTDSSENNQFLVTQPRKTPDDLSGNTRSVRRQLDQSLYLMVKKNTGEQQWQFPTAPVTEKTSLHKVATQLITSLAGSDAPYWLVARHPVASTGTGDEKIFYLRARWLQDYADNIEMKGVEDWAWCTANEVAERVSPSAWTRLQNTVFERV
ncbi:ribosomal protein subunit L17 [Schizosaccharomyces japonicus yFS275]|uniref:Large ribosomal subunit protein mL46 n=1 Tax=Schizosaccharomyces japonicus (strain yFS275 / FY16936) TaxID=402676 RepID=B6JUY7_SCHJY|nr:ribosomal protein subunit L17 [Schizosaccharomyces japonicus yFS275]EEB05091.1 ribosomal protein subunit L17 [Schizosaccharomyces japonicus yFS275]